MDKIHRKLAKTLCRIQVAKRIAPGMVPQLEAKYAKLLKRREKAIRAAMNANPDAQVGKRRPYIHILRERRKSAP